MSYTPPSGSAADIRFGSGYSAPAGNAVNASFAPAGGAFSIASASSFAFVAPLITNPTAALSATASTSLAFVSYDPIISIVGTTTPAFVSAAAKSAAFSASGASTFAFVFKQVVEIFGTSSAVFSGIGYHAASPKIAGSASLAFKGVYQAPARMVAIPGTTVSFKAAPTQAAAFYVASATQFSPTLTDFRQGAFASAATSAVTGQATKGVAASFSAGASSVFSYSGLATRRGAFALTPAASSNFVSSYTFQVLQPPADQGASAVFYALQKERSVYVLR